MKHGRSPYTSTFYEWKGASAVFYSSCLTPFHQHNAIQVILDTQENFKLRTMKNDWNTYRSVIIKENVVHQLDTNKSVQLIIYIEPATEIGQAISIEYLDKSDVCPLPFNIFHFVNSNQLQRALLRSDPSMSETLLNRILVHLSKKTGATRRDERITIVEQMISAIPPAEISMSLLTTEVRLSESRLRALFREVTGISIYRYILWNKIRFATNRIMAGDTVNGAAMEAGFADSSHYHKMMVRVFGISPSNFLKENLLNNFIVCERVK